MRSGRRSARGRMGRIAIACLLASVALGTGATLPSSASAGPARFIYEVCDSALPGGGAPGVSYVVNPGAPFVGYNNCAQPGGSIGIIETGSTASTFSYWSIPVAPTPGGFVESLTITGQASALGPGNDHTSIYEQGWPANNVAEAPRYFHVHDEAAFLSSGAGFSILMNCDGNVPGGCAAGPSISAHYFAATEADPKPPKLPTVEGSLLAPGVIRGHQTLSAEATDEGGGLGKVVVSVNGLPAAQPTVGNCNLIQAANPSVHGTVAVSVTPCPTSLKSSWTLDTAVPPFQDGANTVEVCASDFATLGEPNTTCSAPATVNVNNSCTESPVAGGAVLSAQFAGSHKEEITVPAAHSAKVTGELADNAGDAISGATICVQTETQGSRDGLRPLATTTTDAQGHFSYKVTPGPNRKLLIGYRHDTFQVARSVRFYAHALPTIHLAPNEVENGALIHIRGSVPGPRAGGRVVVLQASALHSRRWFTFSRATANHAGIFHSKYRFDATTSTTTYRIRAVVPRQRGYPWDAGHSQPALVQVRG